MRTLAAGILLALSGLFPALPASAENPSPPPVLLAQVYRGGIELSEYWVSEKLDGVRGYWDGDQLLTRGGRVVRTPDWYTAGWPAEPLDGELWIGRGRFAEVSGIVRRHRPIDADWRKVRFMVFDLPAHPGPFTRRLRELQRLLAQAEVPWLRPIKQFRFEDEAALQARLEQVVARGGEGLMLHRGDSRYRAGRSRDLLKLKPYRDAEATVIAHLPGGGKYQGMLGALLVETPEGLRFRIGTGFTDAQRRRPPPVGSLVTYRHNGFTKNGIPRFARFLRIRRPPSTGQTP